MKPEKARLINDLWADPTGTGRASVLAAGGAILRRKRRVRVFQRSVAGASVIGIVMMLWLYLPVPHNPGIQTVAMKSSPESNKLSVSASSIPKTNSPAIRVLDDNELLALFPTTPVGLVVVNGKKHLVFPNPEDEKKYVIDITSDSSERN